jgi:hypothetical protein
MDFDKPDGMDSPRVFYPLRRGVLITEHWFYVQQRKMAVRDLGHVGYRQSSTLVTRKVVRRIIGVETALVVAIAIGAVGLGGSPLIAYLLGAAHLAAVALVTWFSAYRYPGPLQLWAQLRGDPRLLMSSADQTEFHKVRRALERAIEYNRELAQLT